MNEIWFRPDGSGPISLGRFLIEGHKFGREAPVAQWEGQVGADRVAVSTVFLGLDYNFDLGVSSVAPKIYESMVVGGQHDGLQVRYPTLTEAAAGHEQLVRMISIEMVELQ